MRSALVVGPGGAGASTIAALTAVAAAQQGRRTVLLSPDPTMDALLGDPAPGLSVRRPDAAARAADAWPTVSRYLSAAGVSGDIDPAELASLPAAGTIAILLDIAAIVAAGDCDALIVDAGSSAVELLSVPESIGQLSDRLLPVPLRILSQFGGLFDPRPMPSDPPATGEADLLGDLVGRLMQAQAVLTDPAICSVHLVTGPEPRRRAAARRMVPQLALCGSGLGRVLINRSTGTDLAGEWPTEVLEIPAQSAEPVGAALKALAATVFAATDPLAHSVGPALTEPRVRQNGDSFQLDIAVPLADRTELDLARSADDVLITVAGHTRRFELPSVLQRCTISGARFTDDGGGMLQVSFVADPQRWPRALSGFPGAVTAGTAS
jgi:arsenite-transporting ATPase